MLLTYLNDQARRAFEADRDEVVLELDRLDQELADLTGRIATNPPNLAQLEAQYQSLSRRASDAASEVMLGSGWRPCSAICDRSERSRLRSA